MLLSLGLCFAYEAYTFWLSQSRKSPFDGVWLAALEVSRGLLSKEVAARAVVPLSPTWQTASATVAVLTWDVVLVQAVGVVRGRS